jgi:hypothetical protein
MTKWIAEFDLEDGDTMPEHMDLNYMGAKIDFHCRPMWIPVSEKLPEEGKTVMASTNYGIYPEARYSKKYGWEWPWEAGEDYWTGIDSVEAWMELPEPYKAESEV